jgi:hypothetical protein
MAALAGLIAGRDDANAASTNLGEERLLAATANELTAGNVLSPGAILYAPAEVDDPVLRAAIAAHSGGVVDYFNAAAGTPDPTLLQQYQCVFTWPNFAYADNVALGDNLADFVDAGGNVVLGAFCTYMAGNFLAGRIMTPAYAPVTSPSGTNHFSASPYSGDGRTRLYDGVTAFTCTFRDFLALQGAGEQDGTYADDEIACAYRPDFKVISANGQGGSAAACSGDAARLIANACAAGVNAAPAPAVSHMGLVGLAVLLAAVGALKRHRSVSRS